jgi:integrase
MRLTAATIKTLKLPAGVSDYTHFDERLPGFGWRMRATGGASFIYQYAIAGRTRKFTIGKVDPGKAFDIAKDLHAQVRLGRDPVLEKKQTRIRSAETMGAVLPLYTANKRAALRPNSIKQIVRNLEVLSRSLHACPIAAIDRRMISTLLLAIADEQGGSTANRLRSNLCAFFAWAVREGLVAVNEAAYTNKAIESGPRERVLVEAELKAIWNALQDSAFGAVVKLLMLTGCRRDEICMLNWSEVDLKAAQINLPGERTKNHRPHIVPLAPAALAILRAQQKHEGRDRVFTAKCRAHAKTALDARIVLREGKALAPWVFHDFRRSASTWMNENGVAPHVVEAILGHAKGGIAAVYNKAEYATEKRRALEKWADFITGESTGQVVTLRA